MKIELVEENNDILVEQAEEMFTGPHKEWVELSFHIIAGLDQETAQRVDNCANSTDWYRQFDEKDWKDPENGVIAEFLNKRPDKYRQAARGRRKVKRTLDASDGAEA